MSFKTKLKYKLSSTAKIYTQLSPCPQINPLPVFDRHFLATILEQINLTNLIDFGNLKKKKKKMLETK